MLCQNRHTRYSCSSSPNSCAPHRMSDQPKGSPVSGEALPRICWHRAAAEDPAKPARCRGSCCPTWTHRPLTFHFPHIPDTHHPDNATLVWGHRHSLRPRLLLAPITNYCWSEPGRIRNSNPSVSYFWVYLPFYHTLFWPTRYPITFKAHAWQALHSL